MQTKILKDRPTLGGGEQRKNGEERIAPLPYAGYGPG